MRNWITSLLLIICITATSAGLLKSQSQSESGQRLATNVSAVGATTDLQIWQSTQPITGDATRLLFQSDRSGNQDIFVMQMNGSHIQQLTTNSADDVTPIWSPTGQKIAFASFRDGNWELYVMYADGSGQTRLTNNSSYDGSPAWSPDGNKIAFASERDGNREIYMMDSNGSNVQRLTTSLRIDDSPVWSPDGSKLAFISERDEDRELYVMNRDGSGVQRLTSSVGTDDQPDWSPDGSQIAFVSTRDDGLTGEIYVIDADGGNPLRLTDNTFYEGEPAWSPDGDRILFSRFLFGQTNSTRELFVMSAFGDFPTQLTDNQSADSGPAWQPLALNDALITFRITVNNTSTQAANNVRVQDILPAEVNFLFITAPDWSCTTPTVGTNGTVTCIRSLLDGEAQSTIEIYGDLRAQGSGKLVTNTATVEAANDSLSSNNSATVSRQVTEATDLVLNLDAPTGINAGEEFVYTLDIDNLGVTPAQGVTLLDTLPAGVTLLSCTASGTGICLEKSGVVTVTYATVVPAQAEQVVLRIKVAAAANNELLRNSALVSSNTLDLNANDNLVTWLTEVSSSQHDMQIRQEANTDLIATGATLTYFVHVYNAGPTDFTLSTDSAKSYTNTQPLPIVACSKNSTGCFSAITVSGLSAPIQKVQVDLFEFAHDKPDAVDLLLVAPDGTKVTLLSDAGGEIDPGVINLTFDDEGMAANATQMLAGGVYHPTNIGASDAFAALGTISDQQPALSRFNTVANPNGTWKLYAVDDSGLTGSLNGGWAISFIDSSTPLQLITVQDTLPAGSTFVAAEGEGWQISQQNNLVSASRPALAAKVTSTLTITVTAPNTAGWITSTASVAAIGDPTTANNSASAKVWVEKPIGQVQAFNTSPHTLGVTTQLTATVAAGSNLTYQWDFGDNTAQAAGQSVEHAYQAAGIYTATVTVANGLGSQVATTTVEVKASTPTEVTKKVYLPVITR